MIKVLTTTKFLFFFLNAPPPPKFSPLPLPAPLPISFPHGPADPGVGEDYIAPTADDLHLEAPALSESERLQHVRLHRALTEVPRRPTQSERGVGGERDALAHDDAHTGVRGRSERRPPPIAHSPGRTARRAPARCSPGAANSQDVTRRRCRVGRDRKSTRLNSSHSQISYAVFCLKKH